LEFCKDEEGPNYPEEEQNYNKNNILDTNSGIFSEATCLLSQRYFMPIVLIIVYIFITIVSYLIVNINHISEPLLI